MTECPECGRPAQHEGVQVDWVPPHQVSVKHRCWNEDCPKLAWYERARDPAAVLAKVGLRRIEAGSVPK